MLRRLVVVSIAVLSLCLSCGQPASEPINRQEIEQFIETSLPNDATNLQMAQETGLDTLMQIRFAAPPASIQAFVAALQPRVPLKANYIPFPAKATSELAWWQPGTAQQFAGSGYISTSGKGFEIMVDQTKSQQWLMYMRVYSL